MADVSVEFGAKDTGLENTLKTIQDQLVALDGELKSGTLSFDEINKKMREAAQAEKLHASFGGTKDQIDALGLSFKQAKPEIEKFTENQKEASTETQKASTSFKTMAGEMFELKAALENGNLSADEFDKTLRRLNKLEDIKQKMEDFKNSTQNAGNAANAASPKVDDLGNKTVDAGKKADDSAGLFDAGFKKIAAAFTVGNLAAEAFQKIINIAFDAARSVVQGFSDALDLGGRLNELSARTGEASGKLLVLETAFKNSGLEASNVGMAINKLQNFMADAAAGGDKQMTAMRNLGISLDELNGKTPTQQMALFAQKISEIKDPTDRAAAASEIFGDKLGGRLLPLLTDFSGNLDDARNKVGSLEQVMDENASTFDATGETIDAVKGKMAAFAAGVLSEVIPAVQDLGTSMEEVDAAGLGQKIGSALNPILDDFKWLLKDAQTALDILAESERNAQQNTGFLGQAYNATSGALSTFNQMLIDGLKFITPFDASLTALEGTFVGTQGSAGAATAAIKSVGNASAEAKQKLDALPGAGEALNLEFQNLPQSIEAARGSLLDFNSNLDDSVTSTNNIAEGAVAVKDDFSEISSLTAQLPGQNDAFTQSILGTNEQLNLQPGIYAEVFQGISEAQAKEEERRVAMEQAANKLQASVELQIQLNEAIASGNVEEQARVQKLIDAEAAQKRIKELTDQYIASGLGKEEARHLAASLVNSEIAANEAKKNIGGIKTELAGANTEAKTVKGIMDDIANAKMEASPERLKERTKDARKELKDMADFIGDDLSQMPLDNIIDKLGLDSSKLKTTDEKLRAVEGAIKDIGGADPADITPAVDETGVNDKLEKVKGYLANLEKKRADATPKIDQEEIKTQANATRETITKNLKSLEAEVTVKPKLDKEALKDEVDMAFASSKGTEHLANIDKLVDVIKGFVEKIEGKLPMQALAY